MADTPQIIAACAADPWTAWGAIATAAAALVALFIGVLPAIREWLALRSRARYLAIALAAELEDGMLRALAVAVATEQLGIGTVRPGSALKCQAYLLLIDLSVLNRCITDLGCFDVSAAEILARAHADAARVRRIMAPGGRPKALRYANGDTQASEIAAIARPLYASLEDAFRSVGKYQRRRDIDAAIREVHRAGDVMVETIHATR